MKKTTYPKAVNFSKSQINRCGDILRYASGDVDAYEEAFDCVSAWRAAHLYPLNTFRSTLTRRANALSPLDHPIVAQRLKRMPTIIDKLRRNPDMELSRMQDVGGLRVIVEDLKDVYELKRYYESAKLPHKLINQKDYIKSPKNDGYRGIHIVFKYVGLNCVAKEYDGLLVELQIRTRLEHTWATAVEVAGLMLQEKLKNDDGDELWLEFFKRVSRAFEIIEFLDDGGKYIDLPDSLDVVKLYRKIKQLDDKNKILERLESFSKAMSFLNSRRSTRGRKYFLIVIDPEQKKIQIFSYSRKEYAKALNDYKRMEEKHNGSMIDQVLVSVGSLKQLKIAYPNYFADISDFVQKVRSIEDHI